MQQGNITPVHDFQLWCRRSYFISLAETLEFLGIGIGSVLSSNLSDRFGRKKIGMIFILALILGDLLIVNAQNIWIFLISCFLIGICAAGHCLSMFVLLSESVGEEKQRSAYSILGFVAFSVGVIYLAVAS